jgi:hypothetical protein
LLNNSEVHFAVLAVAERRGPFVYFPEQNIWYRVCSYAAQRITCPKTGFEPPFACSGIGKSAGYDQQSNRAKGEGSGSAVNCTAVVTSAFHREQNSAAMQTRLSGASGK